jgi:hypothetical protein
MARACVSAHCGGGQILAAGLVRGSSRDAQVGFRVSAANEMQNERRNGKDKKNMNQPTRHVKNNPAANPSNH